MTPPRSPETLPGDVLGAEYEAVVAELAANQGLINALEARQVHLVGRALAVGVSGGTHLTPQQFVEWQTGAAPGRAADMVRLARRSEELPHTIAALEAGSLSLDQAGAVARFVAARYDESASRVASYCTVRQLKTVLPWYRDRKPKPDKPAADPDSYVSTGFDERGYFFSGRLPEASGAIVDQALKAMDEDLRRQARAAAPEGCEPERVTAADALVALAETALAAGEAARPGSDRYLVHVHLEAGPDGTLQLMTHLGIPLPDGQRRHVLCDTRLRGLVHDANGAPLGSGRTTRVINRRLRRAVEHRDGGCAVPGCGRTRGLEIHHIWHWEDGGPTDTWNLVALCGSHHTLHHRGLLGIEGNADLPRHNAPGLVFTDQWGHPLDPTGTPVRPTAPPPGTTPSEHLAHTAAAAIGITASPYDGPTGERLDRWGFHLQAADPEPEGFGPHTIASGDASDEPEPPPRITGRRPSNASPAPTGPASGTRLDPTRAGPTA